MECLISFTVKISISYEKNYSFALPLDSLTQKDARNVPVSGIEPDTSGTYKSE
jgi:hypothetical protein